MNTVDAEGGVPTTTSPLLPELQVRLRGLQRYPVSGFLHALFTPFLSFLWEHIDESAP